MGMTRVAVKVSPLAQPDAVAELHMLLDTGAIHTVLPQAVWRPMGLQPLRREEFALADGTGITRPLSECRFEIAIDPLSRRVQPMRVLPLRALASTAA
jgi:predicted aspartyl protease